MVNPGRMDTFGFATPPCRIIANNPESTTLFFPPLNALPPTIKLTLHAKQVG
jgi:hypothetical protein